MADCPTPAVPDALLKATDMREYARQATRHVVTLNAALDMCNADKAALRAWRRNVGTEAGAKK